MTQEEMDKMYQDYYGVYGLFTDEEEAELRDLFNDPKPDNESKA